MPSGNLGKQGKKNALNLATFAQMNTILHKICERRLCLHISSNKAKGNFAQQNYSECIN